MFCSLFIPRDKSKELPKLDLKLIAYIIRASKSPIKSKKVDNMKKNRVTSILLIIIIGTLSSISCATDLYPNQYYGKGLRVKTNEKSKNRKQIQQFDNCSMMKKN